MDTSPSNYNPCDTKIRLSNQPIREMMKMAVSISLWDKARGKICGCVGIRVHIAKQNLLNMQEQSSLSTVIIAILI